MYSLLSVCLYLVLELHLQSMESLELLLFHQPQIVEKIPVESYLMKLAMVIISIIVLGFGISLSVTANVILNSGEAFVKVISDASKKDFGNIKIIFDILCVALAVVLSLIFFNFRMVGTREGTIISAIFTGIAVKFFNKLTKKSINNILIN